MGLAALTRTAVLAAIREYDTLGRDGFLARYEFKRSRKYVVLHDGRFYDSKALCGAAHGFLPGNEPLAASEFSGGSSSVVAKLRQLGFIVVTADANGAPSGSERLSRAFVTTWNPRRWVLSDDEIAEAINETQAGGVHPGRWATGNRKTGIFPGDHVFMFRQEVDRGLVAYGVAASEIYQGQHWDGSGRNANYVDIDWLQWVHHDERMTIEEMKSATTYTDWDAVLASGIQLHPDDARALLDAWDVGDGIENRAAGGDEAVAGLSEGAKTTVKVNRYERNRRARKLCIDHYGTACSVCDLDFATAYGGLATGFIHVHHVVPIASIGVEYRLDPIRDLIPVCPNCHAMLHHGVDTPRSPAEVRKLLSRD